ncbi:MAG: NAD(P)(+) transhydrogenase (Re/Si-specific) subunit beta [Candidatus Glassbacteria bacterium]
MTGDQGQDALLLTQLAYLIAAGFFLFGLKRLSSPATARNGNLLAAIGMLIAIVVTLLDRRVIDFSMIIAGMVVGAGAGAISARKVKMTAMPQMVGIFNGLGGGASALVAAAEFMNHAETAGRLPMDTAVTIMLGTLIGAVTFSGSMIAFGKLQGIVTGNPVTYPLQKTSNLLIFLAIIALGIYLIALSADTNLYLIFFGIALLLGILLVIPIGGADMPVVISLLNSYSGLAAAAAGFVVNNMILIISGALVGASGLILTTIMCKAMNRSLGNVVFGAFGTGDLEAGAVVAEGAKVVREVSPEEAAIIIGYANLVIIAPGYGMAVAQAQHSVQDLASLLEERGIVVKYAIHPVAGRMPGHMNVLLAEAKVPYDRLYDMDEINPEFEKADVALVVGANDVANPSARTDKESPIFGMPILDVDKAKHVIVIKRSLNPGFAGIDNPLFYNSNTSMLFGDARQVVDDLVSEVKAL